MVDLFHKQQEAIQDEKRMAIVTYLESLKGKPPSLGEISRGVDLRDLAKVHYHVSVLVDVELVEKVRGTNEYRLTDAGRADVSRRFPGLAVKERR